jgi:hypothetical protein
MNLRRSLASFLLLTALCPAAAFAAGGDDADKATARELTVQGYDALKNKDYAGAADRFARADSLYHAPTITLGLARARAGLGKLVSAHELYSRVTHETVPPNASAAFTSAVEEAQRELDVLTPRLPGVVINVKGADGASVMLDDTAVPAAAFGVRRPADPGKHVVRATATGFTPVEVTVSLVEGKVETVTLELKPGPGGPPPPATTTTATSGAANPPGSTAPGGSPPPPGDRAEGSGSTQKAVGFVGIGLGGVGLIIGAVAGGVAMSKHSALEMTCPMGHCANTTPNVNSVNSYDSVGTISTAGFIAGGALAVTGIILVATAPKSVQRASITPLIGVGYAGVSGHF